MAPPGDWPIVKDLGRLSYQAAMEVQRREHVAVLDGTSPVVVLLVEHDPVVTISRRRNAAGHLLASPAELARLGIDVQPTDRGGDITYHGPGQLVAYPILRLSEFRLTPASYIRLLERVVIDVLADFGIQGRCDPGATGVWVQSRMDGDGGKGAGELAKICALGVRVRRNVSMHGLALNITTDLGHFGTIVPCGLAGRPVTSMARILGEEVPPMAAVRDALVRRLSERLRERHGA